MTEPGAGFQLGNIRAIALDTNIFHPTLGYSTLEVLAKRAKASGRIEIWIADTVVWEWSEHLYLEHLKHRAAVQRLHNAGLDLELIDSKRSFDIAVELQAKISGLGPHVVILSTEQFAHQALRDQILVSGPGKRKGEVKTGAADSAQLRAYIEQSKTKGVDYVVVSADKDVVTAFKEWEDAVTPTVFKDLRGAENAVFGAIVATAQVMNQILGIAKDSFEILKDLVVDDAKFGRYQDSVPQDLRSMTFDVSPWSTRLIGVADAKESDTGVTFTAFYLATVRVTGFVQRSLYFGEATPKEIISTNALLRVNVTSSSEEDGQTTALATSCFIDLGDSQWMDPADALDTIFDVLELVPGVEKPINRNAWTPTDKYGEKFAFSVDIAGKPLVIERLGHESEEWEIHASYGDHTVQLVMECVQQGFYDREGDGEPSLYLLQGYDWKGTSSTKAEYLINDMIINAVGEDS